MPQSIDSLAEWLEADGLGGFASATVAGRRTRRYHALLLAATAPPSGRMVLVNGLEVWLEVAGVPYPLSSQHYLPDVIHPDGQRRLESFDTEPWPRWVYRLENGLGIEQELLVPHPFAAVALRWRLLADTEPSFDMSSIPIGLRVRPLLSGRDYHALHRENAAFRFASQVAGERVEWHPYEGVPGIEIRSNARYRQAPLWYRDFYYAQEAERGLDCVEDLASPGVFAWNLAEGDAVWIATASGLESTLPADEQPARAQLDRWRSAESDRRRRFPSRLACAADAYIVRRRAGRSIIAGYPWFTDWGRDTFIALRGLAIATGRLDVARDVLLGWSQHVSQGMLPNRFPDAGDVPEYNSVDASLWYIVAVHDLLMALQERSESLADSERHSLATAIEEILDGYLRGTRFGIRVDRDGLVSAGEPGAQLTWMDAKVDDWVVTPRIGKPVEIQALWINALWIAGQWLPDAGRWAALFERAREAFHLRFWVEDRGYLADVIDVDGVPGRVDAALRPNQVFAVGGLPRAVFEGPRARHVVDVVERRLWTPLGLRTLAPDDPNYRPHYVGDRRQRDGAYHQGTAWPWLLGPFVEAWLRVHGDTAQARQAARQQFVAPLELHLWTAGLGHVSEIADADPPHTPRGCPFQAWSLGEWLRLTRVVLADEPPPTGTVSLAADAR